MRFLARPHQLPARLAAAAVFLDTGLNKIDADEETAAGLHGMAAGTYPFLRDMDPNTFVRVLSRCEVALGTALLLPFVPSLVAGAALTGFAAGLVGLYLRTPGMRREGSLRPTQQGVPMVKDIWLLGIGLSLVIEELGHR
ncbi:DoxX family membrane protein [Nonomuraea phyllanthi]|uniref:DoxX family membrane protein n=1 Tax=Nonomuraea phyllanthi TaxID=2219224 RepID=A0A5C4VNS2_9ACTN|nr:DoxX family membrane protein [Nonomuraea phyllanthi]KAB8189395.1 DoxX family membrane protein [Nonomuraea phyllanthi]QFY11689.1 DoxX family membrane protein [Nonomuraea phyllanthi]